jgi:hypothetical protein
LTSSRIGPDEAGVAEALGALGFTLGHLLQHLQTKYLEWINHIGDDPVCTSSDSTGLTCHVDPVCVNGTGMTNETYCGINEITHQPECHDFPVCGEEPNFANCGEDYQWECGEEPTCQFVPKPGNSGSSASCGVSSPSSSNEGRSSAPGGSSGEKGSSGSSRNEKCSENPVSDDDARTTLGTRVTRAFLGIQGGEIGWWNVLDRVYSLIGDSSRFYHTALWLGTERRMGFLLHYGVYSPMNENESKLFFEGDGANFRPMTLTEFERQYTSFPLRELEVRNPMRLTELWNELRAESSWNRSAYSWSDHNCQHFTDRVRDILRLELRTADVGNPKEIPKVLKAFRSPQ